MDLPALTTLLETLRKAGVRRYRDGDLEVELMPQVPVELDKAMRAAADAAAAEKAAKPVFAGKTKQQLNDALPGWSANGR